MNETVTLNSDQQTQPIPVTLEQMEAGRLRITVEDAVFELEAEMLSERQGWARNLETDALHPFYVWVEDEKIDLWLAGKRYHFTREVPQGPRRGQSTSARGPASGDIKAPMPGTILKLLVQSGDKVTAQQPLIIMESMKMEMKLSDPIEGYVDKLYC